MQEISEVTGTGSIVILIHNQSPQALALLYNSVLSAFNQFGIPFCIEHIDKGWSNSKRAEEVLSHAALLFPQSGTMRFFSLSYIKQVEIAVNDGEVESRFASPKRRRGSRRTSPASTPSRCSRRTRSSTGSVA